MGPQVFALSSLGLLSSPPTARVHAKRSPHIRNMTTPENHKYVYIVYCRKSTEDKDRQVISIESQERELLDYANRNNLHVFGVFKEEKSAHKRGRLIFAEIMHLMEQGKANAFLVWQPNRIARNTADGGLVISHMDEGKIREVRTPFKTYSNSSDDKFFLLLEFGMAKKSSDDMIVSMKRGHRAKVLAGWRNGIAPIGYLNNLDRPKGERNIIPDPERFELVQRILKLFLNGEYSVRQIQREISKWGLKTRQTKRQGGRQLPLSAIYKILTESFYYGYFWVKNDQSGDRELHKGSHQPMITEEEFDLIQAKLGRKGKPRPRNNLHFSYTGKIECGECSSMITAEEKHQLICVKCKLKFAYKGKDACPGCKTKIEVMKKPTILNYVYYHCTKQKDRSCTQKSVRVETLESMTDNVLKQFNLSKVFEQWALEELEKDTWHDVNSQNAVVDSQQLRYKNTVAELLNLTKLYTSAANIDGKHLSLEEYELQRNTLLAEKKQLEEAQQDTGRKIGEWIDWAENSFNFSVAARVWFENGSPEQKRTIFMSLSGSNLTLKDKKLSVSLKKPLDFYSVIANHYPSTTIPLEPTKGAGNKRKCLPFEADIPALRAILNDVRTYFRTVKRHEEFPIFGTTSGPRLKTDPLTS
jgi:site-specific DNA recombinase